MDDLHKARLDFEAREKTIDALVAARLRERFLDRQADRSQAKRKRARRLILGFCSPDDRDRDLLVLAILEDEWHMTEIRLLRDDSLEQLEQPDDFDWA